MESGPLHVCREQKLRIVINRSHIILHSIALLFFIHYRLSFFFDHPSETRPIPILPWFLIFTSELLLSFIWLLGQAFHWRPVSRTVFIDRLPDDDNLPAIDVFICTADPEKEPTLHVMNTVLSAMALDYPAEKLHVYLSDDGGSPSTLRGMKETLGFAKLWVPFCRKYRIVNRCPGAYFSAPGSERDGDFATSDFSTEREKIKEQYKVFEDNLIRGRDRDQFGESRRISGRDHPAVIEVIEADNDMNGAEQIKMPLLVYVSREKRPSYPHNFKAGALNVLQRVSGVISNSPYILVLDCDMYCNDPTSAKQAMCFHLDPNISSSLAFVQFPQRFSNISTSDIYDSQIRSFFWVKCNGLDGLKGPVLSGTGFYIKRLSLYGTSSQELLNLRLYFGGSDEFIKSLSPNYRPNLMINGANDALLKETHILASCNYENSSKWGKEVGFLYDSVVEDYLTGFSLHCQGWTSVYCDPPRPQFLGSGTTNLNELLVQGTRWYCGLVEVGISRYCPFIYGTLRSMPILQTMCYSELAFLPLHFVPVWCFATLPQLCLLNAIPLFPKVSSSSFLIFLFIFISSLSKHLYEIIITGGSFRTWVNEQRIWMIKSITSYLYGSLEAFIKKFGMREANFIPTNKAVDDEQIELYKKGIFDFQASIIFLAPMVALVILNMVCLAVGVILVLALGNWDDMLVQILLSLYILLMSYPIIEGMFIRKDRGSIPLKITLLSAMLSFIFLLLGSTILSYM